MCSVVSNMVCFAKLPPCLAWILAAVAAPPLSRNIMHLLGRITEVRASWASLKSARLAFPHAYPPDKSLLHLTSSRRWVLRSPNSVLLQKKSALIILHAGWVGVHNNSFFFMLLWWQRRGLNGFTFYMSGGLFMMLFTSWKKMGQKNFNIMTWCQTVLSDVLYLVVTSHMLIGLMEDRRQKWNVFPWTRRLILKVILVFFSDVRCLHLMWTWSRKSAEENKRRLSDSRLKIVFISKHCLRAITGSLHFK